MAAQWHGSRVLCRGTAAHKSDVPAREELVLHLTATTAERSLGAVMRYSSGRKEDLAGCWWCLLSTPNVSFQMDHGLCLGWIYVHGVLLSSDIDRS